MKVVLDKVSVRKNRIDYNYTIDKDLQVFFDNNSPFFIEYLTDISFEDVPASILSIPFVTNILPLCWLQDFTIEVDELDEAFYNSIDEIKKGFMQIYPDVKVGGKVVANKIINNTYEPSDKTVCLFSGGVDATFTYLRHRNEHPTIINVWGVDINFDDIKGHKEVDEYCNYFAEQFKTDYICIKSTIRTFVDEAYLNKEMYKLLQDYWWHGAQHSIGLLSLLAPYDYLYKVKTNYIASSFTQKDFEDGVKSITFPVVDNALKIGSTKMCHDGFDNARIQKIEYICDVCMTENRYIDLKVCFHYVNGKNCSACEKCYRTIIAILIYDTNLERYGFSIKSKNAKNIKYFLDCNEIGKFRWLPIQNAYNKNPKNKNIKWIKNYKFNNLSSFRSRVLRTLKKILNKKNF